MRDVRHTYYEIDKNNNLVKVETTKSKSKIRKNERFAKNNRSYAYDVIMCMDTEKVFR